MARCNCNSQTCGCVIQEGDGISITGAGTANSPLVISAEGGGGSESGWFPGDLKDVAHGETPAGWLECLGQAVSRTSYADLFDAIGETYGPGNGVTTFNLPSYAGRFKLGAGGGYALADSGGSASVTLLLANLPGHTHTMAHTHSIAHDHPAFSTASGGTHTHKLQLTADGSSNAAVSQGQGSGGSESSAPVESTGAHTHSINVPSYTGNSGGSSAASTGSTGSGAPVAILPPYRVTRVLIKT